MGNHITTQFDINAIVRKALISAGFEPTQPAKAADAPAPSKGKGKGKKASSRPTAASVAPNKHGVITLVRSNRLAFLDVCAEHGRTDYDGMPEHLISEAILLGGFCPDGWVVSPRRKAKFVERFGQEALVTPVRDLSDGVLAEMEHEVAAWQEAAEVEAKPQRYRNHLGRFVKAEMEAAIRADIVQADLPDTPEVFRLWCGGERAAGVRKALGLPSKKGGKKGGKKAEARAAKVAELVAAGVPEARAEQLVTEFALA